MFGAEFLNAFVDDPTVRLIAAAWALDFVLGVASAVKGGTFRLSYFADTFRNDVIGKVFPYYALWVALHVGGIDWSVGGLDVIEEAAGAVVIAALVGSVLNSLRELGLASSMPDTLAGPDPDAPAPPPTT